MSRNLIAGMAMTGAMLWASVSTAGSVYITEFNSNSGDGGLFEYVEITNTGNTPQSMTGWSEDDSTRRPNHSQHSLAGFGTLAPHESAIFTEASPDAFRTYWWGSVAAAPAGLKIIGPYTSDNLSSSGDEVNLYDSSYTQNGTVVVATSTDRLTYGGPNGPTANGVGRNAPAAFLGLNQNSNWVDATVGDSFHSFRAAGNNALIGNPGYYPVPEPSTFGLGLIGMAVAGLVARAKRRAAKA